MIKTPRILFAIVLLTLFGLSTFAQTPSPTPRGNVRTVSIPISIFTKQELKQDRLQEYLQLDRLIVKENGDEQQILSIRTVEEAPLAFAVLIQDDLGSEFNLQISEIKKFITALPRGSRVMVAYLRGGTTQIRQKFTTDLEAAANSLRIVTSSNATAPRNPFDGLIDVLDRF
ncbi:MAG TPA: hypothetical protein PLK77_03405, partial [Pyrinomonadaceae bacterium]|nr:hypothetical protein [Pyrinomonadaceae bacterium]